MSDAPVGVPTCYRHSDRETYVRCQRCDKPICPDCMRDASVGFQCPDCVKEGVRSTRQAQAAYGGRRSANPQLTSIVLIALNGLVWLGILLTGWSASPLTHRLALLPTGSCDSESEPSTYYPGLDSAQLCATNADGQWFPGVADGAYWQLVTSMFTHVQVWHIGFNMLVLWFLAPQLEVVLGRLRFLVLYFLSGLAGSVCVYWFSGADSATVGASGALFGLMGALLVVVIKIGGNVQSIVTWLAINAVFTFLVPGVSWQGHLGGLIGGAIVTAILVYAPRERRTAFQLAGASVFVLALAGATVARTAMLA